MSTSPLTFLSLSSITTSPNPNSFTSLSSLTKHRDLPPSLAGKLRYCSVGSTSFAGERHGGGCGSTSLLRSEIKLRPASPLSFAGKLNTYSVCGSSFAGESDVVVVGGGGASLFRSEIQLCCTSPPSLAGKTRAYSEGGGSLAGERGGGDGGELEVPSFVEFVTSERVKVVMMLGLALALCNADRVVMSVAIVPLSLSHNWSRSFAGVVQSSFLWGYLVSPIAGGALVDYYGGKTVMGWGVALWSLATFLTPWAAEKSLWALLFMRAMLGVAEGVALPSMNNMISRWFPQAEKARAVGIAMAGFQLGSAIGLVLSPILMSKAGVFGPFVIFGLSGFLWVLVWLSATSSIPERSPQISAYELKYILAKGQTFPQPKAKKTSKATVIPPFNRLLSKPPTWSLMVANAMHSWGFFVLLSWMPLYFNSVYHVDLKQAAWFSAIPWTMMALVGYFGGACSDILIQRGLSVTLTRKIMQSIGFFGPAIALFGLTTAKSPSIASAWLTLAVGLKAFSHSGFLVNIQEIAPQYTGVIHGLANTAGTFAAILGTVGAGFFVELVGSFRGFLWLTSFLYILAALFWNQFSTGEQVNFDEADS